MLKISILLFMLTLTIAGYGQQIKSAKSVLTTIAATENYGIKLSFAGDAGCQQTKPIAVEVVDRTGKALWLETAYSSVAVNNETLEFNGRIVSPNGSIFHFTDSYRAYDTTGTFELSRRVFVEVARAADAGFSSRWTVQQLNTSAMGDYDFFVTTRTMITGSGRTGFH